MSDQQGLEELFSRLKASTQQTTAAPGSDSLWTQQGLQPSVSSPIVSPPIQTPNPMHSSRILSPANPLSSVGTPNPDQNRTNNLLNLLRSNSQGGQASPMTTLQNVSGMPSPMAAAGAEKPKPVTSPSNSKDFLLNLLNRPKEPKPTDANTAAQAEQSIAENARGNSIDRLAQSFADASIKQEQDQPKREPTPVRKSRHPSNIWKLSGAEQLFEPFNTSPLLMIY